MTEPLSRPRTPPGNTVDSYLVSWRDNLCDIDIAGFVRVLELYSLDSALYGPGPDKLLVLRDASPVVYRVTLCRVTVGQLAPSRVLEALSYIGRTSLLGAAVFLYPVERAEDIDSGKAKAPGR